MVHGLSCSAACGIIPDQGSNPCPLHWQVDSQPLCHQGSPRDIVLNLGHPNLLYTSGREGFLFFSPFFDGLIKMISMLLFWRERCSKGIYVGTMERGRSLHPPWFSPS